MPQDALDDLRVIDQRHDAHFVVELGCHGTQQRDTEADRPLRLVGSCLISSRHDRATIAMECAAV